MGKGYLQISVYADNIGQPVEDANVVIMGDGVTLNAKTDSSGQTEPIGVSAPAKDLSLRYQTTTRPYSVYTVKVFKMGLQPTVIEGVEIFDTETSLQSVYMQSDPLEQAPEQQYIIPEHTLWGDYPPKIVVDPDSQIPTNSEGDVLPQPLVPEFIIVHDGLPTNTAAPNYYVPFTEYIKNVASSEIYSTWPLETLKANIYAILSFTMNRVYSQWYRSKGYNFTITSSTQFDQKYIHERNIFLSISQVVDSIFQEFITFGGASFPFFSQYNDGVRVNNPGWLSQWGSSDLGNKGKNALEILKYYYGNTVALKKADTIEGAPFSFPGYNLKLGICGDAVQQAQNQLNVIKGAYPALPNIIPSNGKFEQSTKDAVELFQKIFNLPITGIINFATWNRISYVYIGVSKMLRGRFDS